MDFLHELDNFDEVDFHPIKFILAPFYGTELTERFNTQTWMNVNKPYFLVLKLSFVYFSNHIAVSANIIFRTSF